LKPRSDRDTTALERLVDDERERFLDAVSVSARSLLD
jgi:hypothetical protein